MPKIVCYNNRAKEIDNMKLRIQNGMVEINGNTILESVNFEVNDNNHIAIVGRNGSGKTTLLKAIIDNDLFTEGVREEPFEITKIGNFKIGYLEQIKINDGNTLYDEISSSYKEMIALENKINTLEKDLSSDKNIMDYSNALDRFNALGGYAYKKSIELMINKFGFASSDKDKKIRDFSGGEKMKISFMKLLLSEPDLLILDEPTNHLDISAIEWLEDYLKGYKKAFIVVSHDRMFLDNVVDIVYEIEYGETIKYVGNYTKYTKLKKERYDKLLKDYEYQQKEIKRLKDLYERFRFKPTKAKMALSKLKQIERMTIIEKPKKADTKGFKTNFTDIPKPGKIVLTVDNLEFGYDKSLGKISFEIPYGKKIGIIGQNGIGKSTLLKTICNIIPPLKGKITLGYNVHTAYFDQNLSFATTGTVLNEFIHKFPDYLNEEARRALGTFLFQSNEVDKDLSVLSGGEKVRLLLCETFYARPNLMFLDEPTNHLDIVGKEKLENALREYPGSALFVSHDRYFVKQIADALIVFDENGVKYYDYGYEDYLNSKNKEVVVKNKEVKVPKENKTIIIKDKQKEIKGVLKEIDIINEKLKELNKSLYEKEVYTDYQKASEINLEIERLNNLLKEKEKVWEDLMNEDL